MHIYRVQKSDKEVFKKKQTWPLSDLKVVDGKSEHEVCIHLVIYWTPFKKLLFHHKMPFLSHLSLGQELICLNIIFFCIDSFDIILL